MSTWICWYVNSFNDNIDVTIGGINYNDTCNNLSANNPSLFQNGTSQDNLSIGLMCNAPTGTSLPVNATVTDAISHIGKQQNSVNCDFFGGQPKPPNR